MDGVVRAARIAEAAHSQQTLDSTLFPVQVISGANHASALNSPDLLPASVAVLDIARPEQDAPAAHFAMAAAVRDFLAVALKLDEGNYKSSARGVVNEGDIISSARGVENESNNMHSARGTENENNSARSAELDEFATTMRDMQKERARATDAFLTPLRTAFAEQEGSWWFTGADVRWREPRFALHSCVAKSFVHFDA